jgi:hypothetical protein
MSAHLRLRYMLFDQFPILAPLEPKCHQQMWKRVAERIAVEVERDTVRKTTATSTH